MSHFPITENSKLKRVPQRGHYDHATVYEILDAGFICHVGFIENGNPFVIPMTYGRKDNTVYLHGASTSRLMNLLSLGGMVCITVTHIDGIVVARSMFDTSANYRSVVLFGKAELTGDDEKEDALYRISEHILPGRWNEVRQPLANELKATTILKLSIDSATAKIRTGPPKDDARDYDLPVWAGVIPLSLRAGVPENDPTLKSSQLVPQSVHTVRKKYNGGKNGVM
jgi:nitroimidazol reductase NimA-like FMN-containing flavoprotein (pyridoxamine 5'-phosphate oxidase superfamily)